MEEEKSEKIENMFFLSIGVIGMKDRKIERKSLLLLGRVKMKKGKKIK